MISRGSLVLGFVCLFIIAGNLAAQAGTWTQATAAAQWPARGWHAAVAFDNRLWIMGGTNQTGNTGLGMNDVWSSTDGVTWTQATAAAQWSARHGLTALAFNNKLWVLGGYSGGVLNDVWSSTDGVTWVQETAAAQWSARYNHTSVVLNNRMWVVAGATSNSTGAYLNDVWSSADGITWVQETAAAPWAARRWHATEAYNGKLWLMGGRVSSSNSNEVWSSTNGSTWVLETGTAPWPGRYDPASATYNNKLFFLAGTTAAASGYMNDTWSSPYGMNWTQLTPGGTWPARFRTVATAFDNRMWILGGSNGTHMNDVWSYTESFPPVITSTAPTTATVGSPYSYDIVATGVPAPTFSATGLPGWLTLTGNTLSGTPAAGDLGLTGSIVVTATNSAGMDTETFQIDVEGIPPLFTSTPITVATVGMPYSYTVAASGVPTATFTNGALPGWLNFNTGTGELSGTPATADIGLSAQITLTATNGWAPDDTQTFQIDVLGVAPQITSAAVTTATAGQPYTYTIVATGNPAPNLTVGGNPGWLTLAGNVLSGTPGGADVGTTGTIDITAANGWAPDAVQSFQITVDGVAPVFTSVPVTTATPTVAYTYTAAASGIPAPMLSVTSVLPSWLSFNPATGELSGTPGGTAAKTSVAVTLEAANGVAPVATQTFTIQVDRAPGATSSEGSDSGCGVSSPSELPGALAVLALLGLAWMRRRVPG